MNQKVHDELLQHAKEGVFISKRTKLWRCDTTKVIKNNYKLSYTPSNHSFKYLPNILSLNDDIKRLFNFKTHKTNYGYFIPKCNLEIFKEERENIRAEMMRLADDIIKNYDYCILPEVKRKLTELAYFTWSNKMNNAGEPPQTYINGFVNNRLEKYYTKEKVKNSFRFDVIHLNPFINNSCYSQEEITKLEDLIVYRLYHSIQVKRSGLVAYLVRSKAKANKNKRIVWKPLCVFLNLWKSGVFYNDDKLMSLIYPLRKEILVNYNITDDYVVEKIDELIDYIIDNDDYSFGDIRDESYKQNIRI